jgi:hypothetical protein
VTRNWSNSTDPNFAPQSAVFGTGWSETQLPYLTPSNGGNTIAAVANGTTARQNKGDSVNC